jgi:MATE family multidrug resistance protein
LRGYRDTTVPLLLAVIGYWGIGFAGGWLLAFPAGYGPIGLWSGLAVGLAAVAVMLTVRLHFCAHSAISPDRARPFVAKALL